MQGPSVTTAFANILIRRLEVLDATDGPQGLWWLQLFVPVIRPVVMYQRSILDSALSYLKSLCEQAEVRLAKSDVPPTCKAIRELRSSDLDPVRTAQRLLQLMAVFCPRRTD